jgi:hypothetical protein
VAASRITWIENSSIQSRSKPCNCSLWYWVPVFGYKKAASGSHGLSSWSIRLLRYADILESHLLSLKKCSRLCRRFALVHTDYYYYSLAQQPLVGQGLLISQTSRSHSHTQSVGLPWTSDQLYAQTSSWPHTTFIRDRHPWPRQDSNPQSQQAKDHRPMTLIARPLGSVRIDYKLI